MKSDLKNLFIVGTPLQLLNAIEAAKQFKLENNILIVVHRSLEANKVQIETLKSLYDWEKIIDIEYSRHSSIFKYINLVKYLKKHSYKYIFISKLEVVPKIVIPNVTKENVFLLDDGALTIKIYEEHIKTNKINKYNFRELRFLFFGLKIKIRDKINLFTYFDLEPVNDILVIKNNLTFLKESYLKNAKKDNDIIYFVGQPIYDTIGIDSYIKNLEKLIKSSNKKVVYIPHRGEKKDFLLLLSSLNNPLLTILEIGMPIEMYFLQNGIYPSRIISYYSTALTTLDIIYDDCEINPIRVPDSFFSHNKILSKALNVFYKHFDESKIILYDKI
ncbi:MAG: hypothetical protein RQ763_09445 [Sulfurimonas sp.]|uniref:hypothetical protein n=1 Tax=Sulfurimonas sp. TaxID=2022749 RepID=UPI0028CD1687|nr:hypothetical protein [Sulfurimonas sp.]MDT8339412.1 hypothetical protein [Sulfurimonas sp.]